MLETRGSKTPFQGFLFSVEVLQVRDSEGREFEREVVRHPGAVTIVAEHRREGGADGGRDGGPGALSIVMIRNFRIAPNQVLWEIPAGKLEAGEDPLDAAGRELEEETGFRAGSLQPLGSFYTSPGFADELMHVFHATDLQAVGQRLEPGEQITVELIDPERVMSMIEDGTIKDGKTIAALFLWERQRKGTCDR